MIASKPHPREETKPLSPMTGVKLGRPPGEHRENAAQRRRQILDAAIDCIVEYGLSATTLAKVARAAGLSQGVAVFYFKTKEKLLEETLRAHYEEYQSLWQRALGRASADPVERIMALSFAELDPAIYNSRNIALWTSFWGEAGARPRFAQICQAYDGTRSEVLMTLCREAEDLIAKPRWSAKSLVAMLDAMTDGMWIEMHIAPDVMSGTEGRRLIARFLATVFPSRAEQILDAARKLNRSLASR